MNSLHEQNIPLEQLMPLLQEQLEAGHKVILSPRGTSMLPMLRQGIDSVELSPITGKLKKYDIPLYRYDSGKFILHRIIEVGETYTCMGDNLFVREPGIRQDQLIAVVSGFKRGDKHYSLSNIFYQIYCRFWHYTRPIRHFWERGIGWIRRHCA